MSEVTTQTGGPGSEGPTELKLVMGPGLLLLFIVGDILGTGVYALTGDVASEVGGAAWAPFIVAFAVANDAEPAVRPDHFVTSVVLPVIGALACLFLVTPFSGRAPSHYVVAGLLLGLGLVLWALTQIANRTFGAKRAPAGEPSDISGA